MICRQTSFLLLACPFSSLKIKYLTKIEKNPVANTKKMSLMKDKEDLTRVDISYEMYETSLRRGMNLPWKPLRDANRTSQCYFTF